tara:strand:+ start:1832 stop:2026 length:195 start_codon:yes stop_codon:yes gene_type:complete
MATEEERQLARALLRKQRQVEGLLVVIDTAQAALRRAESTIKDEDDLKYVINPSAKWVMSYSLD